MHIVLDLDVIKKLQKSESLIIEYWDLGTKNVHAKFDCILEKKA